MQKSISVLPLFTPQPCRRSETRAVPTENSDAKPTGVVIKRWIIKGVVYYRDVQLKCPDCGEISYRSKLL